MTLYSRSSPHVRGRTLHGRRTRHRHRRSLRVRRSWRRRRNRRARGRRNTGRTPRLPAPESGTDRPTPGVIG